MPRYTAAQIRTKKQMAKKSGGAPFWKDDQEY